MIYRACPYNAATLDFLSQIGMLLYGVTIDSTIVGGPAYNSRQLESGDVIVQVDGVAATPASHQPRHLLKLIKRVTDRQYLRQANIADLLIGSDVPGSSVTILVSDQQVANTQLRTFPTLM